MSEKKQETKEELQERLNKIQQEKLQEGVNKINAILKEYGMFTDAVVTLASGNMKVEIIYGLNQ